MKNKVLVCKSFVTVLILFMTVNSLAAPLTFNTATPLKPKCPGEKCNIIINASGGTPPYVFYVIPETQWQAGDQMYTMLYNNNFSRLYRYTYTTNTIEVTPGSATNPNYYWVAVQDKDENGVTSGTYMLSWWKRVAVYDQSPITITPTVKMDLMTTCYLSNDARIAFILNGGTPWKKGYQISLNGHFVKYGTTYDTGAEMIPGLYKYNITDSLGCSKIVTYQINQPKKIVFNIGYSSAGCGSATNEIWISSVDASTGSGALSTWRWRYSTSQTFVTASSWYSITTKATNVPTGTYYIQAEDGNGCRQTWQNAEGGQSISLGIDHFTPVWKGTGLDVMTIYVASAKHNTHDLAICDEIAAYDGRTCVGTEKLAKVINQLIPSTFGIIKVSRAAFGDNNGYTSGHAITFKFWDKSQLKSVSVNSIQFIDPDNGRSIPAVAFTPRGTAYVKLSHVNVAPVANAGPDQTVSEGDNVTLNGSSSYDSDGDALSYNWSAPAEISLSSNAMFNPTFTAPEVSSDKSFRFILTVNDGTTNSTKPDSVNIKVKNVIPTHVAYFDAAWNFSASWLKPAEDEPDVRIYPNPTTGEIFISAGTKSIIGCKAQVFNTLGQPILNFSIDRNQYMVSLKGKPSGWYFVKITDETWSKTRKILMLKDTYE